MIYEKDTYPQESVCRVGNKYVSLYYLIQTSLFACIDTVDLQINLAYQMVRCDCFERPNNLVLITQKFPDRYTSTARFCVQQTYSHLLSISFRYISRYAPLQDDMAPSRNLRHPTSIGTWIMVAMITAGKQNRDSDYTPGNCQLSCTGV